MNILHLITVIFCMVSFNTSANEMGYSDLETTNDQLGRVISSDQLSTLESYEADLLAQLEEETNQSQQVILYYMLAEVRRDMADQLRLKNHETYDRHPSVLLGASVDLTKSTYRQLASEWATTSSAPESHTVTFQMFQTLNVFVMLLAICLGGLFLRKREFHPFFQKR